ncbi:DUF6221 family protein [Streptomyces sp. NPDC047028]|uniref:DUF6221 family protein n=1 Tax=Streptomyces sp. NPDC047028 TaxID=3155793 RepID=UPI0033D5343B
MDDLVVWLRAQLDEDERIATGGYARPVAAQPRQAVAWAGSVREVRPAPARPALRGPARLPRRVAAVAARAEGPAAARPAGPSCCPASYAATPCSVQIRPHPVQCASG